jgi:hypothetical protein
MEGEALNCFACGTTSRPTCGHMKDDALLRFAAQGGKWRWRPICGSGAYFDKSALRVSIMPKN